jgi:hypothetical protein
MPLLAPAFSRRPNERPPAVHGRVFSQFQYWTDLEEDRDSDYYLGRVGTSMIVTNPLRQGGELRLDVEYDRRGVDLLDSGDASDDDLILDRLSYAIGIEKYSPFRLELGRFYSYYLPETGLLDGAEGALRLENGLSLGAGVGAYPRAFPDRNEGDDLGFHVFLDFRSDKPRGFNGAIGYQKTWHEGDSDRDMLIARASTWIGERLWLYGLARFDIYTSEDELKSSGPDLTEAWFQARYTFTPSSGAALSLSHYTWADVKREEFELVPDELIEDGRVDRIEARVWRDIVTDLRGTIRANYFNDQNDDGFGGEFDLDWRDAFHVPTPLDLHGAIFYSEGSFTELYGFRAEGRVRKGGFDMFLGYEFNTWSATSLLDDGGDDDFTRHAIRGGASWQIAHWYLNLTADRYFGDSEDSYVLGSFLEYRF